MAGPAAAASSKASEAEQALMRTVIDKIIDYKDASGNQLAEPFLEVVKRKELPDYYKVIKNPIALHTIQNKIKQKRYNIVTDFIYDCARVFHNAKTYNKKGSGIFNDAVALEEVLLEELKKHAESDNPVISPEDAILPDLGPLPESGEEDNDGDEGDEGEESGEDEGSENSEDEPDDDEEQEDEDEEMVDADAVKNEDADNESDGPSRTRRSSRRVTKKTTKSEKSDDSDADDDKTKESGAYDAHKKRGRPPRVDTPNESRIKAILKGIRKFKDENGDPRHAPFEKYPDPKAFPEYHQVISRAIAIDTLKKRVKRREYQSVESFMEDVNIMFDNAMKYYDQSTDIYRAAVFLKEEARKLFEIEMAKDDSEYMDETSKHFNRIPVDYIDHNGDRFRVGDWVHLRNPNPGQKSTVGQIFRTWKTPQGKFMIAACWYYRPEQTVHRINKRFYENEVAKTGQYRDHEIEDVLERVFVMFYTKASRGRPPNSEGKPIYICEARYSEEKKHFNRIKTWKSCIPDEVRNHPDDTVYWEKQIPLKKFPSPIKHLLKPGAKKGDPLPNATWGVEGAPPVVGAVYIGDRRPNDSPSPEPTPPPRQKSPTPPTAPGQATGQPRVATVRRTAVPPPPPQAAPQTPVVHRPVPHATPQYGPQDQFPPPKVPAQLGFFNQPQMQPMYTPNNYPASMPTAAVQPLDDPTRPDLPSESVAVTIDGPWPKEIRELVKLDEKGNPIFFTNPPAVAAPAVISFKDWGPGFENGGGIPFRPRQYLLRRAALRALSAYENGIPFDEEQQRAWPDALKILTEFMKREHAAAFVHPEIYDRSVRKAMVYPLEQAFEKILQEKEARGETLNTTFYNVNVIAYFKIQKIKQDREDKANGVVKTDNWAEGLRL
ncbi:hypothetical protein ABW19_dt0202538 [Dactylella cylindrospora]|nr:hypothetical protein ABW19_dt0202538 [Dactylella cylindrospora]